MVSELVCCGRGDEMIYSIMEDSEIENYVNRKIKEGFIDPDFFSCMFIDSGVAVLYDALEEPKQRVQRFKLENTFKIIKWFQEFDINGYLIVSPEMIPEVNSIVNDLGKKLPIFKGA